MDDKGNKVPATNAVTKDGSVLFMVPGGDMIYQAAPVPNTKGPGGVQVYETTGSQHIQFYMDDKGAWNKPMWVAPRSKIPRM